MKAKALVIVIPVLVASFARGAAEPSPDTVLGKWWFPKKDGWMEIARNGDTFNGKVVAFEDREAVDEHNPDPELAKRPFIGITMLEGFKFDPKSKNWIDGTIYDGESGKTYKCKMWFEGGDFNRLNARGFIGFSLLGRTEVFTRVTPEDEARGVPPKTKAEREAEKKKKGSRS